MVGVTGSAGFLGSSLIKALSLRAVEPIRALHSNVRCRNRQPDCVEVMEGDLRNSSDCDRFAAGLSAIYHLAHRNVPLNSDENQAEDAVLNILPTLNLIGAIQRSRTRPHLVYFSSGGAVYGRSKAHTPFRESDPCAPMCSYGIQKLTAEHYLRLAAATGSLTAIILRIGNAYGGLLPESRKQGLIGIAVKSVLEGRPVRIFGNMNNVRDYIHLNDICTMAELARSPQSAFDIFNVGSGVGHSVAEVVQTIEGVFKSPIEISYDASEKAQLTDWTVLDCTKAKQTLGWMPTVSLTSGIEAMISAWTSETHRSSAIA
jgi:UDP-glucose 4-epimerase